MELPQFKYHPDPVSTGSIVASDGTCEVCGQARGFVYTGPIYCKSKPEAVCPWCIADGSAHAKFKAECVDRDCIGGGEWESVAAAIVEEVAFRTPGFSGWQSERWFTHCADAAEFLGPMGKEQLQQSGPEAVEAVGLETGYDPEEWDDYFAALDAEHGPATAYLFKCRHCGKLGGYSDCH
jgi:uncharacterized protein